MTSSTPPPRPPRRDIPPLGGDSVDPFSDAFKLKLSGQIEKQAKKISESQIINSSDSESYELDFEEEFERSVPIAQNPLEPTIESQKASKVDAGRKNFLSRMVKGLKDLAKSVKDSGGAAINSLFSGAEAISSSESVPLMNIDLKESEKSKLLEARKWLFSFENDVFREKLTTSKAEEHNELLKSLIKSMRKSKHPDIVTTRNALKDVRAQLKEGIEKDEVSESNFVGIISNPEAVERLEKIFPSSLLFINKHKFIASFNMGVELAVSRITEKIDQEGLFRTAGDRNKQLDLLDACYQSENIDELKSLGENFFIDDFCDLMKTFALQYDLLFKSGVITDDDKQEFVETMGKINDLLKQVRDNKENQMNKNNIEIAAKIIIKNLSSFGHSDFIFSSLEANQQAFMDFLNKPKK